jgi:hypothetical protein
MAVALEATGVQQSDRLLGLGIIGGQKGADGRSQ